MQRSRARYLGLGLAALLSSPLDDPEQFRHVRFVMKGGVVYRRDGLETVPAQN
jgi:hypothetical protein